MAMRNRRNKRLSGTVSFVDERADIELSSPSAENSGTMENAESGVGEVDIRPPSGDDLSDEFRRKVEEASQAEEDGDISEQSSRYSLIRELAPHFERSTLREILLSLDREPFTELLTMFMGCYPDPDKVKDFADRNPYQWTQALNLLAKMSGYTEKVELSGQASIVHFVKQASDSDLMKRLREVQEEMSKPLIDVTPVTEGV